MENTEKALKISREKSPKCCILSPSGTQCAEMTIQFGNSLLANVVFSGWKKAKPYTKAESQAAYSKAKPGLNILWKNKAFSES